MTFGINCVIECNSHNILISVTLPNAGRHDTQRNNIQHNDTQHNDTQYNHTQHNDRTKTLANDLHVKLAHFVEEENIFIHTKQLS